MTNFSAEATDSSRAVYGITVAAELVGAGEQALRLYERKGLLAPSRTAGGTRRYSDDDLVIVRRVMELLDAGVNLVGARHVLELEAANRLLRSRLEALAGDGERE
ncbi:MerR family transcriptional regulator [soil metagenome]